MARMYPPALDPQTREQRGRAGVSDAERAVWHALRENLGEEWTVIHSLWHRTHDRKVDAEADFVLIGPVGVIVLEAKGGIVERDDEGYWLFSSAGGHLNGREREGPFDQARGAMYGLRRHLKKLHEERLFHDHVWGYGVITPGCQLTIPSTDPDIRDWMALGQFQFPGGLHDFVLALAQHWREDRISKSYREEMLRQVSPGIAEKLVTFFRPAIGYAKGIGVDARRIEQDILRLTSEQQRVLEISSLNDRVVLRGGAGTGKTVLAVEQARRHAALGRRVLLVCFNRNLADSLRTGAEGDSELEHVQIYNYHQLVGQMLRQAGLSVAVPEDWATFNREAVRLVLEAIDANPTWQPFDVLVVDESQDLMASEFMSVLDLLVANGLESGTWTMCLDPTQAIFEEQFDNDCEERIRQLAVTLKLTVNCRNTRPIHAYAYGLGGLESVDTASVNGPQPVIEYYRDRSEFRRRIRSVVNRVVSEFRDADLDVSEIVILLAQLGEYLDDLESEKARIIAPLAKFEPGAARKKGMITWTTVQSFKGLEAKAVILAGLRSLRGPVQRRLYYVGASRAQSVLTLLLPQNEEESVRLGMSGVLKLMSGGTKRTGVD